MDSKRTNNGWMGPLRLILHVLRTVGADTDETGRFYVRGSISAFLGMPGENVDNVVGPDAEYRRDGYWCNLAVMMNATSYGLRNVTVI